MAWPPAYRAAAAVRLCTPAPRESVPPENSVGVPLQSFESLIEEDKAKASPLDQLRSV
ncbi:hypothetical protein THIARS_60671 [Thiomonas delicata]|uniref:Uncharacterized protein n=1 Tax=Thiomonas delicata TaxID=364030 RepID=A0A238D3S9_THIDL|nr:hypothetical protein THIARS_60671 [Thiomonas delicata]